MEAIQKTVTKQDIELLEESLLSIGEDVPAVNTFAPGVLIRTAFFRKGLVAIGHEHKTRHANIVSKGKFSVIENGSAREINAGDIFISEPGVRKVALFHENTEWSNIHWNPANETDQAKLEDIFIIKSPAWLQHHLTMEEQSLIGLTNQSPE